MVPSKTPSDSITAVCHKPDISHFPSWLHLFVLGAGCLRAQALSQP
jgi:hypothetical protein